MVFRSLSKTAIGTVCALFFGVVGIKLLAVLTGPSGVGLFSILRQLQQTGSVLGSLGGQAALVQGLASREGHHRLAFMRAALLGFLGVSSFVALTTWFSAPWLANWLLNDTTLTGLGLTVQTRLDLVNWCALAMILGATVVFFQGVLNGHRALGRLAFMQVIGAAIGALCAYPAAWLWRANQPTGVMLILFGGLIGSAIVGGYSAWRAGWLQGLWNSSIDKNVLTNARQAFWKMAISTLLGNTLSLLTLLLIRAILVSRFGLQQAGVFDVAWTISSTYVVLILSSLGAYYLPSLSAETSLEAQRQLISKVLRLCAAAALPLVGTVIFLREPLVHLLYTVDFLEATMIMRWMLLGDYLKICSWVLAMPLLARAQSGRYLLSEVVANLSFLGIALLIPDLEGFGIAFLVSYVLYLSCVAFWAWRSQQLQLLSLRPWAVGGVVLISMSWFAWNSTPMWSFVFIGFSATTLVGFFVFKEVL
jgi:O-antigen/teichoic acid export membrane protein